MLFCILLVVNIAKTTNSREPNNVDLIRHKMHKFFKQEYNNVTMEIKKIKGKIKGKKLTKKELEEEIVNRKTKIKEKIVALISVKFKDSNEIKIFIINQIKNFKKEYLDFIEELKNYDSRCENESKKKTLSENLIEESQALDIKVLQDNKPAINLLLKNVKVKCLFLICNILMVEKIILTGYIDANIVYSNTYKLITNFEDFYINIKNKIKYSFAETLNTIFLKRQNEVKIYDNIDESNMKKVVNSLNHIYKWNEKGLYDKACIIEGFYVEKVILRIKNAYLEKLLSADIFLEAGICDISDIAFITENIEALNKYKNLIKKFYKR